MENKSEFKMIETSKISPCPYQCRYLYKRESMEQLINSIKENGILQPLTATEKDGEYELIAGHRRLFAAKMLKMEKVPVIVMEKTREEIAVLCTVENIHREELNFFEQAMAIKLLIDQLGLTQVQAGQRLSLTQSAVANKLKLLHFSKEIMDLIIKNNLTERHARAISRLEPEKQKKAIEHIIKNNLNVAATDKYIDNLIKPKKIKRKPIIKIKDVRLFTNTITKAIGIMKNAGFSPVFNQNTTEEGIEYNIIIPFEKENAPHKEHQTS